MAKSTKHQDKVGSFESFKAPWETDSGEDAEIDKAKLKRFIFNLKSGEAKALDAQEDAKTEIEEAEQALEKAEAERDEAKKEASSGQPDLQKKIEKLEKKVSDLTTERDNLVSAKELADLRTEVIGNLDPKYAKYVVGTTKEELEKSLADVKADFGISDEPDDDDDDVVRTGPRPTTKLRNPSDPNGSRRDGDPDFDAIADQIIGGGRVFG